MEKKTVCLVMIVKNEAHLIVNTLKHLLDFIPFDYWCISDTGSTDTTKEDITAFFKEKGIPGEICENEWKDFGHNRTLAFQNAFGKSDYAFVWDADDEIRGNFVFPKNLVADHYKFMFGNETGLRYERVQLFNNKKRWEYVGVLHEYPRAVDPCGPAAEVSGDYYFLSGRSGARNKNPNKYQDDARILDAAFKEALAKNDPIHKRYAFYCAQSYCSARMDEKAIEHYKIVLTLDTWLQEKYMSCLSLYESYEKLGREKEGLVYLVESYKYDPERVECYYRLIKYYCIHGPAEVAFAYYKLIENYYETKYPKETFSEKLFVNKEDYDFYLPYYMTIVGDRVGRPDISAKMFTYIVHNKYLRCGAWWIHNVFTNMQFSINLLPYNLDFFKEVFDYVDALRDAGIFLTDMNNKVLTMFIDRYAPLIVARPLSLPKRIISLGSPRVVLTMTTCKRYELFEKTVHSLLNMWTDYKSIDSFFCVDDNSSEEDRAKMRENFPFFEYYMKEPAEKGHRESMNIIWNYLKVVQPKYWIHLEDDWMYFHQGPYVERAIGFLEKYEKANIHQLVFNKNYGVVYKDLERTGGILLEPGYILHEKRDDLPGHHCGYWPHYSLQPSISRVRAILDVGPYDSAHRFFERGQAEKYFAKGYYTGFFNSMYSVHIGKQHWEKEGMNAYALNEVSQFAAAAVAPTTPIITEIPANLPLRGTMSEHLNAIFNKILAKRPFGLIRPSDGEYSILLNTTLTNCDKWTFQSGGILQKQLADSIRTVDPNLYIGIPCNTGPFPWNCTKKIYKDYICRFKVPVAQRTYSNIFMDSNWKTLVNFLKNYTPGFYSITSGKLETTELPIKGRLIIDEHLVSHWDKKSAEETARVTDFVKGMSGELICFSAGPLSKVWIPQCMKANPTNMYVDIGSALDKFTRGVVSRPYMDPDHLFSTTSCRFDDSIAPKKNLVYMCVFHKQGYVELLKILLASIQFFSKQDNFDILVMTSADFEPEIMGFAKNIGIHIECKTMSFSTLLEACCARLSIFEYEYIDFYEKLLYIDTDIVVQGDLTELFEKPLEERLYALAEWTIGADSHGASLFDPTKYKANTPGINSGILLFKNCHLMSEKFADIRKHITKMSESGLRMPECYDQPFFNYHFIKDMLHETTLLEPYATIYDRAASFPETRPTKISLCHFTWPLGNSDSKGSRMKLYIGHIIKNYAGIFPVGGGELSVSSLVGKRYGWGNGFIQFAAKGILHTRWGTGTYFMLDNFAVNVSWNHHHHIIKMNPAFDHYVGFKINDFSICSGSLHAESLYTYEDSNVSVSLEPMSPTDLSKGNRNLVYACVFHKKSYIDLLKILMTTYVFWTNRVNTDFVVFTSKDFEADIYEYAKSINLPIKCKTFDFSSIHESFCARLYLFDYEEISMYKKALYLDTDIVLQGDLQRVFDEELEDKIYAVSEGTVEHEIHGGWFFDFTKIDKNLPGFNSGVLLFPVSNNIRQKFAEVIKHLQTLQSRGGQLPECLDQCLLNYNFIKDNCYDVSLMKTYAKIYCYDLPPPPNESTTVVICHFVWPLGNAEHKKQRMEKHLRHVLINYSKIFGTHTETNLVLHKRYSWGSGYIQFNSNGILHSSWSWSASFYTMLDSRTFFVEWNGNKHIMRFSSDYTSYTQIGFATLHTGWGSIEKGLNYLFDEKKSATDEFQITAKSDKYLIYACVFFNKQYVELLKLLLVSYRFFSYTPAIDILIFTSREFEADISAFAKSIGLTITCKILEIKTMHESSCARLYIFDYENIKNYTKAMYIDTDVIIQGGLTKIFEHSLEDKIYGVKELTIERESHGGWFFDFTKIDKGTTAINAGILLFKISARIKNKFQDILLHIQQIKSDGGRLPKCFDQPFVNYHFIKDGTYDNEYLNNYALLYHLHPPPAPTGPTEIVLCHFVEPLGDSGSKMKRMVAHLSHLVSKYGAVYPITSTINPISLVGKRYSWGSENHYIKFSENGSLLTPWTPGTYTVLDENTVYAIWGGFTHLLRFGENAKDYISIRQGDCIVSCGTLI